MRHDILIADSPLTIDALPLDVAVVVPTLNEAANVEKLIAKLSVVLAGRGWEVLFVDDNSADGIREQGKTLALIPDIIRRLDAQLPRKGAAPPAPPLPEIPLMWDKGEKRRWWRYALTALLSAAAGAGILTWLG